MLLGFFLFVVTEFYDGPLGILLVFFFSFYWVTGNENPTNFTNMNFRAKNGVNRKLRKKNEFSKRRCNRFREEITIDNYLSLKKTTTNKQ